MVLGRIVLTIVTAAILGSGASAQEARDVQLYIGGDTNRDACPSTGDVVGLDPHGDGFLSVRSGPGGRPFREIDRIHNGQHVLICAQRGAWMGIVYDKGAGGTRCNVLTPHRRRPYAGPCRAGWVHQRFIRKLAG
jgi:hypothetical protein